MNKYLLVSVLTALAMPAYADVESFVNAAKGSDVAKIQEFLDAGENVNAKNELGNTALHYATATGNSDMVKFLLEKGADANIANDKGWTPLAIAEKKKLGDIVNMFQSAQNNKDLSDLVAKASENAKVVEQKVGDVKEKTLAKTQELKENTSTKVANIKEKTIDTVNDIKEKTAEVKENVADKVAEVKENVASVKKETVQKVETAKEVVQNKVDETEKSVEKTVSTTAENVKETENKVENKAKEVVATAVAPVAQESTKAEVKAEAKAEEPKAEPKTEVKAEPKAETNPAPKAEAKPAPKPAPRRLIKPVSAKPAPRFLASSINKAIYAGDEEIVYCLYYLGLQTDQHNLTLASEFFAGTTTINKSRFDYIADLALKYYDNASTAEMQNMANTCSKIITPKNRDKQNQIIRAMNKAIGY